MRRRAGPSAAAGRPWRSGPEAEIRRRSTTGAEIRRRSATGAAVLLVGLLGAGWGCARPVPPTGGPVPETPLAVVDTRPGQLAVVAPFPGPVSIQFQRRVSERPTQGSPRDGVVVSPRTGEVDVRLRSDGLEISMEGGFLEPTVYRITILPHFQDLYQNRMEGAFDLFFSTGGELQPNLLAGIVSDRLTLEEVPGVRVDAVPVEEGRTHSTVTDSTGIFTFPYLPADRYTLIAYEDLNRNRGPDFQERQDSLVVGLSLGDTLVVTELALLAPDTTAAVLESASSLDSLSIRVTFDDHLDPEMSLDEVEARMVRDDGDAPEVVDVLWFDRWEPVAADPADPPPDLPPPDPPAPADPVLPSRDLVLVLSSPLLPEVTYRVELDGVRNVNGVPGGGGTAEIEVPPEPEPGDPPPNAAPNGPVDPPPDLPPGGAAPG